VLNNAHLASPDNLTPALFPVIYEDRSEELNVLAMQLGLTRTEVRTTTTRGIPVATKDIYSK